MPDILEHRDQWDADFRAGFLAHYEDTGQTDWSRYNRPDNRTPVSGPAIDLSESRLLFISSAGGYLPASQKPFEAEADLGDYSIRTFPVDTPFSDIAYAHTHYDHTAINADPQVLLPLKHLSDLVNEGVIGELAPLMISFSGYHPDLSRVLDETIPAILAVAHQMQPDAALLVPS